MTPEVAIAWIAAGLIAGAAAAVEASRKGQDETKKERATVPVPVEDDETPRRRK